MADDFKITTEMLYQGALLFALMDAILVPFLVWRVREEALRKLQWPLAVAAGLIWCGIWFWALGNFWERVYRYVFPAWAQRWMPLLAGVIAVAVALILWFLALRFKRRAILAFCFSGGVLGVLTHMWALQRGIVSKPPMLQGASPLGAVTIAFFEYVFYWAVILIIAEVMEWAQTHARRLRRGTS